MFFDFEINTHQYERQGVVEYTDLTDIDRAVGSFLLRVVDSFTITDADRKENKEFADFVGRETKTKLYTGIFDSHDDFLRKLAAKLPKDKQSEIERNKLIPTLYVGRDLTFMYEESGSYVDQTWGAELARDNKGKEEVYAKLSKSYPLLTYNVSVLAWEKSTISRLSSGLTMWLRHTKQGRPHTFAAKTKIAGSEVELKVSVKGAKDITGTPDPVSLSEKRLWGQTFSIEFVSEFLEAEAVTKQPVKIQVATRVMK